MAGSRKAHGTRTRPQRPKGWKITSRLRLIVAAPLVAVLGFAGLALATSAQQAQRAATLGDLVTLGSQAGNLAYELQRERAAAAGLLTSENTNRLDAFLHQAADTDQAVQRYQRMRGSVSTAPGGVETVLTRIDRDIAGLQSLRQQVRSAAQGSVSAVAFGYRILIADLLGYRSSVAQAGLSNALADDIRAAAALANTVEAAGQQQIAVLRAVASGQLTPAMQQDITAARTGFIESSAAFLDLARPAWRVWWEQAGSGDESLAAQRLQDRVGRAAPGSRLAIDATDWTATIDSWTDRLFKIQQQVDAAVVGAVREARTGQIQRVGLEAGAMGLALLLTMLVTAAVARQITRQLRHLREAANTVAFERLPTVVNELRSANAKTIMPEEAAVRSAEVVRSAFALDRSGADEIGEVAQAFTEVHRAAVRTAAEQAIMRANMAEIFVHLSRREQRLVDSVLAQVDVVERDETDPDRLRQLYDLDNLATRMARINASLLVLGGVGVGRVRAEDIPLPKILQAALSQIQHYTRVRFGIIDDGVAIVADAVDDIVHMFAELMDNATSYSPPESEAWVTARALGDRVIVQIGDEGVGLPPQRRAQLNELLTRPPSVDVVTVRSMGLVVVGHLAARFGARVELRAGPRLGTIAEVTLPSAVFRTAKAIEYEPLPLPAGQPTAGVAMAGAAPTGARIAWTEPTGSNRSPFIPQGRTPADGTAGVVRAVAGPVVGPDGRDTDATAELPIFQQVNNWFHPDAPHQVRAGAPVPGRNGAGPVPQVPDRNGGAPPLGPAGPGPAQRAGTGPDGRAGAGAPGGPGGPVGPGGPGQPGRPGGTPSLPERGVEQIDQPPVPDWRTRSDEAWRAASALSSPQVSEKTTAGLPQRVPQQHLVPNAIDTASQQSRADHRDPSQVAAALSAYARGVAGRKLATPANAAPAGRTGSTS